MSSAENNNSIPRQLGLFSFAGVINTAVGYAIIFSGMALGLSPYLSNLAGYALGLICAFFLNKMIVFAIRGDNKRQAGRFLVSFLVAYAANLAGLHAGLLAKFSAVLAQIMAGIIYFVVMFILSRIWVFKH